MKNKGQPKMRAYKIVNRVAYDAHAQEYTERAYDYWERYPDAKRTLERFLRLLPGPRILDLGSGGGRDSEIFLSAGKEPVCLDVSRTMLRIARTRGLEVTLGDFEQLPFTPESFHGVWAYASLCHAPHAKLLSILRALAHVILPGGPLLVSLPRGTGEVWENLTDSETSKVYIAVWQVRPFLELVRGAGFALLETRHLRSNAFEVLAIKPK